MSSTVRKVSTKTLSILLMSARDQEHMKQLFALFLPGFASAIKIYYER